MLKRAKKSRTNSINLSLRKPSEAAFHAPSSIARHLLNLVTPTRVHPTSPALVSLHLPTDSRHVCALPSRTFGVPTDIDTADPPDTGCNNLGYNLDLLVVSGRVDEHEFARDKLSAPPTPRQRMALAPAVSHDEIRVSRVQRQVHGAVARVCMAYLASTGPGNGDAGEEAGAVLLEATGSLREPVAGIARELLDLEYKLCVDFLCANLRLLALRSYAADLWLMASAVRQCVFDKVASLRPVVWWNGNGTPRIPQADEREELDFEVA